jgi:3-isopropylmalate dehydrogenase
MAPTLELVQSLDLAIDWIEFPSSEEGVREHGSADEWNRVLREAIDDSDATLIGSISSVTTATRYLRWGKQTFANVRPMRWRPGYRSPLRNPEGIDYVFVRENLEDTYVGIEGSLSALAALPSLQSDKSGLELDTSVAGAYALKVITEEGTRRLVRFACELALTRKERGHPGTVTCTAKYNSLPQTDGLFRQVAEATVAEEYPNLRYEQYIVDDFAARLVLRPAAFDVVVIPNLYGDILSDLGAGTLGGLGLAPSGCYGAAYAYFESIHGSAPDLAGRNVINPTATLLSAAMLLEHLGYPEAAARIEQAVARVYADGRSLTPDQGGRASTVELCDAVRAALGAE